MIGLARPSAYFTPDNVQHKTSSRPRGAAASSGPAALGDIREMAIIRDRAASNLARPATSKFDFVDAVAGVVDRLFAGRFWHYQPADLRYHDYQHTLQAAWVYLDFVQAARENESVDFPVPTLREAELGFAAILLHDTGYLKARGDDDGSGAKYTYCHVLRGCALAASILPSLGCEAAEIEDVLGAIRCTGLSGNPATASFRNDNARFIASLVASSDYLGQMAAPEYPVKLPHLFAEFAEADAYAGIPPERRQFTSAPQLLAATGAFWSRFVRPKLDRDFAGVHRLLRMPRPDGPNPYFLAIERNLAAIAATSPAPAADAA